MTERGLGPEFLESARKHTHELRESDDPAWWRALRERLLASGVDPGDAAIGSIYPEDVRVSGGVIATRDDRAFRFELAWWFDEGDEPKSFDDAELTEWDLIDPADVVDFDLEFVALARSVLREEQGPPRRRLARLPRLRIQARAPAGRGWIHERRSVPALLRPGQRLRRHPHRR